MKKNFIKELPIVVIGLSPLTYLLFIWNSLPEQVALHWNFNGDIDRYGSKNELIVLSLLLPVLTYLLLLLIPKIDPKHKINKMGNKLYNLKLIMTIIMSGLAIFIIYSTKNNSLSSPNYLIMGVGILVTILGNYFKTIKPNYFIGVKTPWTLESESVWKKTHDLAGKIWFIGGIIIFILSLFLNKKLNLYIFISLICILALVPIIYSYLEFKKEQENNIS